MTHSCLSVNKLVCSSAGIYTRGKIPAAPKGIKSALNCFFCRVAFGEMELRCAPPADNGLFVVSAALSPLASCWAPCSADMSSDCWKYPPYLTFSCKWPALTLDLALTALSVLTYVVFRLSFYPFYLPACSCHLVCIFRTDSFSLIHLHLPSYFSVGHGSRVVGSWVISLRKSQHAAEPVRWSVKPLRPSIATENQRPSVILTNDGATYDCSSHPNLPSYVEYLHWHLKSLWWVIHKHSVFIKTPGTWDTSLPKRLTVVVAGSLSHLSLFAPVWIIHADIASICFCLLPDWETKSTASCQSTQ